MEKLNFDSTRVVIMTSGSGNKEMRYVDIGNPSARLVIFIHGAPGSLDAFNIFLKDTELRSKIRMIAMDRPGYGASNFGVPETSVKDQSTQISALLGKNLNAKKPIIVGHSFGATIAAQLAIDNPDKLDAIILVGAAIDPDHEKFLSIAKLVTFPVINKIIPESLKVAGMEKITHRDELDLMLPDWYKINCRVSVLHGAKDGLVPVENAWFAQNVLINADPEIRIYEDSGHLIPWTHPEIIKNEILFLIEK